MCRVRRSCGRAVSFGTRRDLRASGSLRSTATAGVYAAAAALCGGLRSMRTAPLSPGELAHVPEFIEKWTAIGYSSEPIDRDWAEWALARFYDFAGLSEPWVVWAPCPISALLSAAVYGALTSEGRTPETRDDKALDRMIDLV